MTSDSQFERRNRKFISLMNKDRSLRKLTRRWFETCSKYEYSYHFKWMGRPIIQFPQDILAMQEIIWKVKPDLIIETGIAHGGSLIFYASILELIGNGSVVGIDIDIRKHNKHAIENHPLSKRIRIIEGSSVAKNVYKKVFDVTVGKKKVLVVLDSNHVHKHVLKEMHLYSPLVSKGSYLIVLDTIIEDMPKNASQDRPWSKGNNPKTAVDEFLKNNDRFKIDKNIENKLLITVAPNGYLKCVKD